MASNDRNETFTRIEATDEYVWPDGSSTTTSPNANPNANLSYINVRDYGAAGDGSTDDLSAVRSAISAAETEASNGNPVALYFPSGRYYIGEANGAPLEITESHITVVGDGMYSSIIESHDDTGGDSDSDGHPDFTIGFMGASGSLLEGVGFESIGYENQEGWDPAGIAAHFVEDCFVHNCYASNEFVGTSDASGLPIWLGVGEENTVENARFSIQNCHVVSNETSNNKAIELSAATDGVITDNLVELTNDSETGISAVSVENAVVSGNVVNGAGLSGANTTGPLIQCLANRNVVVSENVLQGNSSNGNHGIAIGSSRAFDDTNYTVSGNIIHDVSGLGIVMNSPTNYVSITGNTIDTTTAGGIRVHTTPGTIANNYVRNVGGVGIENRSNSQAQGLTVSSNVVEEVVGPGIRLHSPRVSGATVTGNVVANTDSFDQDGIEIVANDSSASVERFIVSSNMITRTANGILIDSSADGFIACLNRGQTAGVIYNGSGSNYEISLNLG